MKLAQVAPTLAVEQEAWESGIRWVAGVDEVGVGPLAGPVVAGAVALRPGEYHPWFEAVRDSKMLTEAEREELAVQIQATVHYGIGWVTHEEINAIGIYPARKLCIARALEQIRVWPGAVISDAIKLRVPGNLPIIKADMKCVSVAAGSVIAKVARDRWMTEICPVYRGYAFCRHKGYSTPEHRRLLLARGPSPIHRISWNAVAQYSLPFGDEEA